MKPLILGVAYHGNRLLSHVESDMRDIVNNRFNTVVHMFSHNDWDRHSKIMKEIFDITRDNGLDFWVDNWGLGGPPGDKSHFLCYHPEAHQYYSDGEMIPTSVCLNSEAYVEWTKEWVDLVYDCGKDHNIWIQAFNIPAGTEEDIVYATEAAYDAGARQILVWGYRGSEGNNYRAKQPNVTWSKIGDAFHRILDRERDMVIDIARSELNVE